MGEMMGIENQSNETRKNEGKKLTKIDRLREKLDTLRQKQLKGEQRIKELESEIAVEEAKEMRILLEENSITLSELKELLDKKKADSK